MRRLFKNWRKEILQSIVIVLFVLAITLFAMQLQEKQKISYKTYKIGALTESEELKSEIYIVEEGYISRILPETTLRDLKNNLDKENISVYKKTGGQLQDSEFVGTGMKLEIGSKEYKISVIGDLTGNGKIGITDLTQLKLSSLNLLPKLVDEYKKSGDMNNSGSITITDVTRENLALVNLIDVKAPSSFVPEAKSTKDTITVRGETSDSNSGIKEYWFELNTNGWVKNTDTLNNEYVFTGLTTETKYTVRMKVVDNEGNTKITKRVEVETLNEENANISILASPTEWTNQNVLVAVNYNSNVAKETKQISIDNGTTWTAYTEPVTVNKNTIVKARVLNSNGVVLEEQSKQITNIDKLPPKDFTLKVNVEKDSVIVDAETSDQATTLENGCSGIKEYNYILNDGGWIKQQITAETRYIFSGLTPGIEYTIEVIAIDNAGNEKKATNNETIVKIPILATTLEIDPNGGEWEGNTISQTLKQDVGTTKTISNPVREGYVFSGWKLTGGGTLENGIYTYGTDDGKITAEWTPIKCTLTYNANGGTVNPTSTTATYNETITMPTPTRSYTVTYNTNGGSTVSSQVATYTFNGWYTAATGGTRRTYTKMPALSETLYAQWTSASVTLPTPSKTGYAFEGWYIDSGLNNKITEATYTPTENTTLYAKWVGNGYTLTYNANGGTVNPTSTTATYNETIIMPTPNRSYTITYNTNGGSTVSSQVATYIFNGWYTAATGGTRRTYTKMPALSETLYAQWTSSNVTLPTPTKTGYTIDGWYSNSALTNKVGNAGAKYTPTENTTLYAKWTENTYTLTYNAMGGTVNTTSTTAKYNASITMPTPSKSYTVTYNTNGGSTVSNQTAKYTFNGWYTSATNGVRRTYTRMPALSEILYAQWTNASVTLPTPTKAGYTFEGWCTDSALNNKITGATYTPIENTTLYAKWTGNTYTLTYDANGGTVNPTSTTAIYNETITMPTPSKSYEVTYNANGGSLSTTSATATYTFNGWYTAATGGTRRKYTRMPALNETLYAQWQAGSLRLPTPTKTGYTIEGWYSDSALTNKVGNAGATYAPTENITLYAKWTGNSMKIYSYGKIYSGGGITGWSDHLSDQTVVKFNSNNISITEDGSIATNTEVLQDYNSIRVKYQMGVSTTNNPSQVTGFYVGSCKNGPYQTTPFYGEYILNPYTWTKTYTIEVDAPSKSYNSNYVYISLPTEGHDNVLKIYEIEVFNK